MSTYASYVSWQRKLCKLCQLIAWVAWVAWVAVVAWVAWVACMFIHVYMCTCMYTALCFGASLTNWSLTTRFSCFFFFSAQSQDKRRFKRNCRLSCDWAIVFNLYYLFERSMTGQAASITTDCHLFLFIYFLKKIYFYLSFFF